MEFTLDDLLAKLGVNTNDERAVIHAVLENFHERIARLEYLASKDQGTGE